VGQRRPPPTVSRPPPSGQEERLSSGSAGPAAFKTLLTDFADYFDRAPRGAALETLQKFGVRTG
ncbi:unnamed protein product, partial [Ascophyllum nodosum]